MAALLLKKAALLLMHGSVRGQILHCPKAKSQVMQHNLLAIPFEKLTLSCDLFN
ncbi:hypothetical protein CIPAW_16G083800 [Carya illinoinensis]|uniref:Uncharacterized protein n=1 Tax=Carya illinoinensis TaxID=32201 RepID=A0A8T1N8A4_CARIL|nr:hypothetical protein CIPAW_16G083800 [Carya illinoinensis]